MTPGQPGPGPQLWASGLLSLALQDASVDGRRPSAGRPGGCGDCKWQASLRPAALGRRVSVLEHLVRTGRGPRFSPSRLSPAAGQEPGAFAPRGCVWASMLGIACRFSVPRDLSAFLPTGEKGASYLLRLPAPGDRTEPPSPGPQNFRGLLFPLAASLLPLSAPYPCLGPINDYPIPPFLILPSSSPRYPHRLLPHLFLGSLASCLTWSPLFPTSFTFPNFFFLLSPPFYFTPLSPLFSLLRRGSPALCLWPL